jgi:SAM-dependent methyltransferase
MKIDIRSQAARYYDLNPNFPNDIPFYKERLPSSDASVLELGCGTGRVTIPLSQACKLIYGIDLSEAMISICREKIKQESIPPSKIMIEKGDITKFVVAMKFDLIFAPFRVFQNLETDRETGGFFECVKKHLAPGGKCILNVFMPNRDRETLKREWCSSAENLSWEVEFEGEKIACFDRRPRMDKEKLVLYPELIYRKYKNKAVVDETVLKIVMRCYYPDELVELIQSHGFEITNKWGGYNGEIFGQGPELVVEFVLG